MQWQLTSFLSSSLLLLQCGIAGIAILLVLHNINTVLLEGAVLQYYMGPVWENK